MESTSDTSKIIADIIKECKLPQTSGYRKINSLIDDGLLVNSGQTTKESKKVNKYISIINNVKIHIEKNKMIVDLQLNPQQLQNSSILQIAQQL